MLIQNSKISVIGLGKLGQCLAITLAHRDFNVLGLDINADVIKELSSGKATINEPGLQKLLNESMDTIAFSTDVKTAVIKSDVTIIIVNTPSDVQGRFSNNFIETALTTLSKELKKSEKEYHLFIISSTVMPLSTEQFLIPIIEKYSGRTLNEGFGVCYCPELVALGSVVNDFLEPGLIILGESDKKAGDMALDIYKHWSVITPEISRMNIVNAEITKVSVNVFMTTKISFANHLSNLCEQVPGADIDVITESLGKDYRISPNFLKGGLSFGGTCLPRDIKAFDAMYNQYIGESSLMNAFNSINSNQNNHTVDIILNLAKNYNKNVIGILGLSFKSGTPEIKESPAINIIKNLITKKFEINVFDPIAIPNVKKEFGDKINYSSNIKSCIIKSDIIVIATPCEEFIGLENIFENCVVFDCWRILDKSKMTNVKYFSIGRYEDSLQTKK
jgi:UDPglucose 6-dehydrogenase